MSDICGAHMHPLPCPGFACRPTADPTMVSLMRRYRAEVAAGQSPPWIWELRLALGAARSWLRWQQGDASCAGRTLEHVEGRIVDLHRAGWDGDDETVWRTAESMARFTGAMPRFPQEAREVAEVRRWRERQGSRRTACSEAGGFAGASGHAQETP